LKTTTSGEAKKRNGLPPIHPGEIIKQDILPPVGLSVTAAAKALGVSRQMLHGILAGRFAMSGLCGHPNSDLHNRSSPLPTHSQKTRMC
jgi:hypothetical protein